MTSCLLSQSLPGAKLTFLDGMGIPGGLEVGLDLVTENWTQPVEVPRSLLALLVTNTGARARDVLSHVSIPGDDRSPARCVGVGWRDRLQYVSTDLPCALVLTRLTEKSVYAEIPEETKSS